MKKIKLKKGHIVLLDDEEYEKYSGFRWWVDKDDAVVGRLNAPTSRKFYTPVKYLHREIMNAPADKLVDHKNGNPLDNRKSNLRIATKSTNGMNRGAQKNSISGIKGVYFNRKINRWRARLVANGQTLLYKNFLTKEEAIAARKEAAIKHHGKFAYENR